MKQATTNNIFCEKEMRLGFSGHETFPFRYTWLKKAVDAVEQDRQIFSKDSALIQLGVGKNMVTSIRHWALLAGILEEYTDKEGRGLNPTVFGHNLLGDDGWDPYLEDVNSLWLLHWRIATNRQKAATWYYAFNVLSQIEFTKEQLQNELFRFAAEHGLSKSENIIERDVDCFIRCYVASKQAKANVLEDSLDCPLSELGILQEIGQRGLYVFSRGVQKDLCDEVFISSLLEFWDVSNPGAQSLAFDEIAYSPCSPGRVFKLSEDALAYRLEQMEDLTKGAFVFRETASLRQLSKNGNFNPERALEKYYNKSASLETR